MTPQHYYNYRRKHGRRAADKRHAIDERSDQWRRDQRAVDRKVVGMGCNE